MTQMVRKEDMLRMLKEAFEQGGANDPQLIPNLMTSINNFTPTFEFEITIEQAVEAQAKVEDTLIKYMIF